MTDKHSLSGKLQYQLKQYQGFDLQSAAPEDCAAWMDRQRIFRFCRAVPDRATAVPAAHVRAELVTERPRGPTAYFVGRGPEMAKIETAFRAGESVVFLYGVGGIGKSEICRKLFYDYAEGNRNGNNSAGNRADTGTDRPRAVGWVTWRGSLKDTFYTQFRHIREDNAERYWTQAREYMERRGRDLLIFLDNGDDMTDAQAGDLSRLGCRVLVTSRRRPEHLRDKQAVQAGTLTPEQCRVLYRRAPYDDDTLTDDGQQTTVDEIIRLAGYHTLAVELLAKTQSAAELSAEELLDELRETGFNLSNIQEEISYDHRPEQRSLTDPDGKTEEEDTETDRRFLEHMARLFDLSVLRKDRRGEDILRALRGMCLLAPSVEIPVKTARTWLDLPDLNGLNRAVKTGWLNGRTERTETGAARFVSIHPLIAAVTLYRAKPDAAYVDAVAGRLDEAMDFEDTEVFSTRLPVVSHAVALDWVAKFLGVKTENRARMLNQVRYLINQQGDYASAMEWYQKALHIWNNIVAPDYMYTAEIYNNIGVNYYYLKNFDKALDWLKKAREIREKVLGLNHPDTLQTYINIAEVYRGQKNYAAALTENQVAQKEAKKALGERHLIMAETWNIIALVNDDLGNYEEALIRHRDALQIKEKVLGLDHPTTAITYNNMGVAYYKWGDYREALNWLEKALAIRLKFLGVEHPLTKATQENIADVQQALSNNT